MALVMEKFISFRRVLTFSIPLSICALMLATPGAFAQESLFGSIVNVSANPTGEDREPVVVASGSKVYVAWSRLEPTGSRVVFRRSIDRGQTWDPPLSQPPIDLGPGWNPELAVAGENVYLVVLDQVATSVNQLFFRASADAGVNWTPHPSQSATNLSNLPPIFGEGGVQFHSVTASDNNAYVVWNGQHPSYDHLVVQFRGSTDKGATWNPPLSGGPRSIGTHPDDNLSPDVASVGSEVYVVWGALRYGSPPVDDILFARSMNNGASFSAAVNIGQPQVGADPRPAVATNGAELFFTWGNVFIGNEVDTTFRKATIGPTLIWTPPLSDPPVRLIEASNGCSNCWWDIATSAEGVFVVSHERRLLINVFGGDLRYRETWDAGTSWLPSTSQPAADVGLGSFNFEPRVAASEEQVYVVWEDDQDPDDGRSEIGFRIGHRPRVSAQVRNWTTARQVNPHWASLNESPSLPLTLRWKTTLPAAVRSSPISYTQLGHIYVGADDGKLYALDASDGSIVWSFQAGGPISRAATAASDKVDHLLFVTSESGDLLSLDPANGSLRWQVISPPSPLTSAPLYNAGMVFYTFVSGPSESTLRAVDAGDGSVLWEVPLGGMTGITPMEAFRILWVGIPESSKALVGVDDGGQLRSSVTDGGTSPGALTSGVADLDHDDFDPSNYRVYVSTHPGELRALSSRGGPDLWQIDLNVGGLVTGLALTQHRAVNSLIVSQLDHLYALGPDPRTPDTMEIRWVRSFPDNILENQRTPRPAIWGGYIIHVFGGDELVAISLSTGGDEWSVTLDASTVSSPSIDGQSLYIGDLAGNVYSYQNLGVAVSPVVGMAWRPIMWFILLAVAILVLLVVLVWLLKKRTAG